MRELSPDPLPRDHLLIWVTPDTFECAFCPQPGGSGTTVDWIGKGGAEWRGPDGRCRECGAKYLLAQWHESVPSPEEQERGQWT